MSQFKKDWKNCWTIEFRYIISCHDATQYSKWQPNVIVSERLFFYFPPSVCVALTFSSATLDRPNRAFIYFNVLSSRTSPVLSPFTRRENLTWPEAEKCSSAHPLYLPALLTLNTLLSETKGPLLPFSSAVLALVPRPCTSLSHMVISVSQRAALWLGFLVLIKVLSSSWSIFYCGTYS